MQIKLHNIIPFPLIETAKNSSDVWERDFSFHSEYIYQISAPSGTGKTSLISILYGLRQDFKGEFFIDNTSNRALNPKDWQTLRQNQLSIVPQGLWIFDELTALENIQLNNRLTNHLSEDKIQEMLEISGMATHQHKKAGILSFGQKQRIAIIRALAQPFSFLLLDEVFSHLDKDNQNIMWQLMVSEAKKQKAGIIITSLENENFNANKIINL